MTPMLLSLVLLLLMKTLVMFPLRPFSLLLSLLFELLDLPSPLLSKLLDLPLPLLFKLLDLPFQLLFKQLVPARQLPLRFKLFQPQFLRLLSPVVLRR